MSGRPTTSAIILHPSVISLRERRDALRAELARLVAARMALLFDDLPALRYRYAELFGPLERKIEQKTLEHAERKRMMELFVLKMDRGQTLDEATISLTLKAVHREFARMRQQVGRMAEDQQKQEERNFSMPRNHAQYAHGSHDRSTTEHRGDAARTSSRDRREQVRRIYRTLAKRLHPDVAGTDDPLVAAYWQLVRNAMEREDLDLLRTLENVVATGPSIALAGAVATPEPPMAEQIVSLIEIVERERRTLVDLQNSEPWTLRRKLDDERWIARQQEILREKIAEIDEEVTRCNEFLAPILSRTGTRITPDNVAEIWNSFVDDVYLSGRF